MKKKLPPYGKQLKERMRSGYQPTNGVNIFTSWSMGAPWPHCLIFPPGAGPDDYHWNFLAGQEISLINTESFTEYKILKQLAVILVQSGVKRVGLIDLDHPLHWFLPEVKGDAA